MTPPFLQSLDKTSSFESLVRAVFCDCTKSLGRNVHGHMLVDFGYENTLLLHVWRTTNLPARIKLRCTSAVRVAATDLGGLAGYFTNFSHRWPAYYHVSIFLQPDH